MMRTERMTYALLAAVLASAAADAQLLREPARGQAVERQLPGDRTFTQWVLDPNLVNTSGGDRMEVREVAAEQLETVKLTNVVPPIHFAVGVAEIPDATVVELAPRPLDIVVQMSGYAAEIEGVPWLDGRHLQFAMPA